MLLRQEETIGSRSSKSSTFVLAFAMTLGFSYRFAGDVQANPANHIELYRDGEYFFGVDGSNPTGQLSSPADGSWYTVSSITYFAETRPYYIGVRFHCGAAGVMTFNLDSFWWNATLS